MNRRHHTHLLRAAVLLLFATLLFSRCASIMTPSGGPKDSLPPVIVRLSPENFSTNRPLTGHERIYIDFDEYIQIKDQQKEFYTSPAMKKKPLITQRGRGIMVQLRDTLAPNTTYSLNFGSSIRDNNAGNPLHSMRYVFSTGPEIDSMILSGYTADSHGADSVPKTFLWFFPVDSIAPVGDYDSTIFNHTPAQIARAETNGIFIAQNLKPIAYRVYAVQDKNDNQLYDPSVDQVGFLDAPCNPAELPDFAIWYDSLRGYVTAEPQLYLRMFTDKAFRRQLLQEHSRPMQHKALLHFSAAFPQIESLVFDSIPADRVIIEPLTAGKDTLAVWFDMPADRLPDTIRGRIEDFKHDTANRLQPVSEELKLPWRKIETKEEERERENLERERRRAEAAGEEWEEPKQANPFAFKLAQKSEINPENHLWIEFDYPLTRFDSTSVLLTRTLGDGSVEDRKVHFVRDTAALRRYQIRSNWQLGGDYTLTIPAGALQNVAGEQNDSIVGSYTVCDPEKFATLLLHITAKDPEAEYVVQLLDKSGKVDQERRHVRAGEIRFNYVAPGEVQLRVIEDKNGNGIWDTGSIVERRQPERTERFVNDKGEELFVTRPNWEIELTMDMDKLFAPITMQSLQQLLDERERQRLIREEERRSKEGNKNRDNHNHNNNSMNSNMFSTGNMFNTIR